MYIQIIYVYDILVKQQICIRTLGPILLFIVFVCLLEIVFYCITVDFGTIVVKCKNRVHIEHLSDRKSLLSS